MNSFSIPSNKHNYNLFFKYNENSIYISKSLHTHLNSSKKQIDNYYNDWDNIKKYTNPYEFIHTTIPQEKVSVSKLKPLSRSFYKMIEIVKSYNLLSQKQNINTFHLAEGPGGFIEATNFIRKNKNDSYIGMSLIDDVDDSIPGWKKSGEFLKNNPHIKIEKGINNNGNLLEVENLISTKEKYGRTMDFITADGGFDFSSNFNEQENMASNLLFSEICFAIHLQKVDGCFVLKMFDLFTKISLDMIFFLNLYYKEVYIMKPRTSRSANSEKYVICKYFSPPLNYKEHAKFILDNYNLLKENTISQLFGFNHDSIFNTKLEEINALLGQNQIENINNTFNILFSNNKLMKCEQNKKNYIQKCINWCEKHDIPYNKIINNNIFSKNDLFDETNSDSTNDSNNDINDSNNENFSETNTCIKI
jgi:23S rRNA U2552 (ribose-2'-O)-methylase RlmE/FtsJ